MIFYDIQFYGINASYSHIYTIQIIFLSKTAKTKQTPKAKWPTKQTPKAKWTTKQTPKAKWQTKQTPKAKW